MSDLTPVSKPVSLEELTKQIHHCIASVGKRGYARQDAIKICVASAQKAGYLEPGTATLTAKGKAAETRHTSEKGDEKGELSAKEKEMAYQQIMGQRDKNGKLIHKPAHKKEETEPSEEYLSYLYSLSLLDSSGLVELGPNDVLEEIEFDLVSTISDQNLHEILGTAYVVGKAGLASGAALLGKLKALIAAKTAAGGVWKGGGAAAKLAFKAALKSGKGAKAAMAAAKHALNHGIVKGSLAASEPGTLAKIASKVSARTAADVGGLALGAHAAHHDKEESTMYTGDELAEGLFDSVKNFFGKLLGKGDLSVPVNLSGLNEKEKGDLQMLASVLPTLSEGEKKALQAEMTAKIRGALLSTFSQLASQHAARVIDAYPSSATRGVSRAGLYNPQVITAEQVMQHTLKVAAAMDGSTPEELQELNKEVPIGTVRARHIAHPTTGKIHKIELVKVGSQIINGKKKSVWARVKHGSSTWHGETDRPGRTVKTQGGKHAAIAARAAQMAKDSAALHRGDGHPSNIPKPSGKSMPGVRESQEDFSDFTQEDHAELQEFIFDAASHVGVRAMKKDSTYDHIKDDPEAAASEFGKLKPHIRKGVATGGHHEWDVDAGQAIKTAATSMFVPAVGGAYTGYRAGRRDALVKLRKEKPEVFKKAMDIHHQRTGERH